MLRFEHPASPKPSFFSMCLTRHRLQRGAFPMALRAVFGRGSGSSPACREASQHQLFLLWWEFPSPVPVRFAGPVHPASLPVFLNSSVCLSFCVNSGSILCYPCTCTIKEKFHFWGKAYSIPSFRSIRRISSSENTYRRAACLTEIHSLGVLSSAALYSALVQCFRAVLLPYPQGSPLAR